MFRTVWVLHAVPHDPCHLRRRVRFPPRAASLNILKFIMVCLCAINTKINFETIIPCWDNVRIQAVCLRGLVWGTSEEWDVLLSDCKR